MVGWVVAVTALGGLSGSCGARTGVVDHEVGGGEGPVPQPEMCNGLDDDLDGLVRVGVLDGGASEAGIEDGGARDGGAPDGGMDAGLDGGGIDGGGIDGGGIDGGGIDGGGIDGGLSDLDLFVDEDFRDSLGRYVDIDHCGRCGAACRPERAHELETACGLVDEYPTCVATRCEPGFVPSTAGRCVPIYERLCLFCADDGDCGDFVGASCESIGDEQRCTIDCALTCPDGYGCSDGVCAPTSGSCTCETGDDFDLACALEDPEGLFCPGSATCRDGVLSECVAPPEECDHEDDDCNGIEDDGFVDRLGAYSLDIHHCGDCGVDCTLSTVPEGDLVCGGDPFAPTCVLFCPDTADGIDIGDRVDGDRNIATGCECTVSSVTDDAGPVRTSGSMLDVNCDGADGIVVQSFYVAPDGNDAAIGSPTRPLRTLAVAVQRAHDSIGTGTPRPHVFVASGTYAESLELLDGVFVHGGYRRDFLALDPDGFRVEIRAPSATSAPGGAAVVIRGAGTTPTLLEWVFVRGRDATMDGAATFGIYAIDPGPGLTLRDLEVRAGAAGAGASGRRGTAGVSFESVPTTGDLPRGAAENAAHACLPSDARNTVRGGMGGVNRCGGADVSGGAGGSSRCPMMSAFQPGGSNGRGTGAGSGGPGGQDSRGPITAETGTCPVDVCCGLADFSVPTDFVGPQPGRPGVDGSNGRAGGACTEPFGRFMGDVWDGMDASGGTDGTPGSGGGGGGAGGGAEMDWFDFECEFVDGLGGGGGGGGSGGCGGGPGTGATSGAPSVAILIRYTDPALAARGPTITGADILSGEGGRGGDGGAGGEGGRGVLGAFGGELPRAARSTPTLSGPFGGGRGGAGGDGGAGGGGGGGCGGASVGIWVTGLTREPTFVAAWRTANSFVIGAPGPAGRGGGGPSAGADGAEGGASDVLVR
jgi:hypothetical protein